MATVPAKPQKPLHNFSLPFLKWGQRTQANASHHRRRGHRTSPFTDSSDSDLNNCNKPHRSRNDAETKTDGENGGLLLEREKRLSDADAAPAADGEAKPWNLRPRRLVISSSDGVGAVPTASGVKSGWLLRGVAAAVEENDEEERKKKKRRLWISLSKEEIEEDVYALTGSRPARRPKKRNKTVQKQVDNIFPGLYLVGISVDSYRV